MELHYRQYSDSGKPLLILHGLFGNLKNWNWHARELARDFRVYALDLRNHGESPHSAAMDYRVMAEDVLEFIDNRELSEVSILGHSMGGKVAMQLALNYPHRVSRLLVVDIAPTAYGEERGDHEEVFEGLLSIDLSSLQSRTEAETLLTPRVTEPAVRQFLVSNLVRDEHGRYEWRFNLPALYENYGRLREGVSGSQVFDRPVLFIKGAMSNYLIDEDRSTIERLFPAARLKTVMGAGHWLHAEKPQVFYKLARDFFAGEESEQ
jgi:esterase